MKSIFFIFVALTCGCATTNVNLHPDAPRTRLFPNGVYYHDVILTIKPATPQQKKYTFDGVVKIDKDQIIVIAMSFFGTTEFRIIENIKTGEVSSEVYREGLKKFEPQLKNLYSTLRTVLMAQGTPTEMTATQEGTPVNFVFSGYDKNKIPVHIEINHPQFQVKVKIKHYEI